MINYEQFCQIKDYHQNRHLSATQIARELNLHPGTVAKWLETEHFCQRKSVKHCSKLDTFKPEIVRWLETHPYSAAQILLRLREMGFCGGISIVKDYVRKI